MAKSSSRSSSGRSTSGRASSKSASKGGVSATRTAKQKAAAQRQASIEQSAGVNATVSKKTDAATKAPSASASATQSGGGASTPSYAPGSRPNVITRSGKNVISNGRLVGQYKTEAEAAAALEKFTSPTASGQLRGILGDKGGETYRQLYRTDKGTQTGKANVAGAVQSFASKGLSSVVGTDAQGNPTIVGAADEASARKMLPTPGIPQSVNLKPYPSIISKSAPVLREESKEQPVLDRMLGERGVSNINDLSLSQQQLVREAVNEEVYGMSYPNFKGGTDVLTTAQKAQERAIASAAESASQKEAATDQQIESTSRPVVSVITSDQAKQFTEEQYKLVSDLQNQSNIVAQETVDDLLSTDPDILAAQADGEDMQNLLEERRAFYEEVYNNQLEQIKQSFDDARGEFREQARVQMGGTIAQLARMGIFGVSTAAVQYVNDVERANNAKLLSFAAEEAAALQKAYEAYTEADFDVAEKMITVASDTRKEIREIKSQQLDQKVKMAQLSQLEAENAATTIENIAAAGMTEEDLPPDYLNYLDAKQGLPFGTSAGLLDMHQAAAEAKKIADAQTAYAKSVENADKLVNLLGSLPPGQSINIDGVEYSSINTGDVITGTETASDGSTYLWSYNKDTGEKNIQKLGNFGNQKYTDIKSNEGAVLRIYEDGQQRLMFDPRQPNGGVAQGGLIDLFPDGSVTPFTRPNDPDRDYASECGAWVNDITGLGVGDSYQSKIALTDPSITAETAQIGDVFVQPYGSTGHVGIINGMSVVNGEVIFTVSESNWKKLPESGGRTGIITHTRQVKASEISGFARPGLAQDFYNFGTGAPNLEGLTFGETTEDEEGSRVLPTEDIAKSPEAKKMSGIVILNNAINNYRDLVEQYGSAGGLTGGARQKLDSAKEAINLAIKDAEALGALQAPDIELVSRMVPDVTYEGVRESLTPHPLAASRALGTIDQLLEQMDQKAQTLYELLITQGDNVASDPYVQELASKLNIEGKEIKVRLKSTGQVGTIPEGEFDSNVYEKL